MLGMWLLCSAGYKLISKKKGADRGRQQFLELMLFMPEIELGSPWEEVCLRTSEQYSRKPGGKPSKTIVIWKQEYSSCQILQTTFLTKLLDMSSCDTVLHGI